jgi:23S rRNA (uridine2552-2'-O)-methyltransferase
MAKKPTNKSGNNKSGGGKPTPKRAAHIKAVSAVPAFAKKANNEAEKNKTNSKNTIQNTVQNSGQNTSQSSNTSTSTQPKETAPKAAKTSKAPKSKHTTKSSLIIGGRATENVRLKNKDVTKSSREWLERQLNDPFVVQAKKLGYRSRATFKIKEIDEAFDLFKPNHKIVDLGSAPGGWSQYAVEKLRGKCTVAAIDLLEMEPLKGVDFIQGDFTENDVVEKLETLFEGKVDVVLSDMAPNSTGHTRTDHLRIMWMLELALDFAIRHLKPGGDFVVKVLRGGAEKSLYDLTRKNFTKVKHFKPKSSRQQSTEIYLVAKGFKG